MMFNALQHKKSCVIVSWHMRIPTAVTARMSVPQQ